MQDADPFDEPYGSAQIFTYKRWNNIGDLPYKLPLKEKILHLRLRMKIFGWGDHLGKPHKNFLSEGHHVTLFKGYKLCLLIFGGKVSTAILTFVTFKLTPFFQDGCETTRGKFRGMNVNFHCVPQKTGMLFSSPHVDSKLWIHFV